MLANDYAIFAVRVEESGGWDRQLDADIHSAFPEAARGQPAAFKAVDFSRLPRGHDGWFIGRDTTDAYPNELPRYTRSVDDAIGLVERVMAADASEALVARMASHGVIFEAVKLIPYRFDLSDRLARGICCSLFRGLAEHDLKAAHDGLSSVQERK